MASISRTPNGGYRVLWRENGIKRQKNFRTKVEAKAFQARVQLTPQTFGAHMTVAQLIEKYKDTETPCKARAYTESRMLIRLMSRPFAKLLLRSIAPTDIEDYAKARAKEKPVNREGLVSPSTIDKELRLLSTVFNYGVRRKFMVGNPCKEAKWPRPAPPRERVASADDMKKLFEASGWDGVSIPATMEALVVAAFRLGCLTGMRSGEMLRIEEAWIEGRVIHLPAAATKTRKARNVALSTEALRIIDLVRKRGCSPRIFGDLNDKSRVRYWTCVRDRAGLGRELDSEERVIKEGLNFHDSRATFCTWAASPDPRTGAPRLDVLTLARQTGHDNLKTLMRYYRPTPEETAKRLD